MEYIYASMLLHKAGKKITEESVAKILEAAGVQTDTARTKALVSALETVNIEDAIKTAVPVAAVAAPTAVTPGAKSGKEEKKEKEKKEEKEEVEGLGALFG